MKTKLASSLALVVKIDKVSLYAFDSTPTNLLHFWKERKKENRILWERCAAWPLMPKRYGNAGLQNLWAVNSPITSFGVFFSFLPVVMSIASLTETYGLLRQARNDLSNRVRPIRGKIPQARPRWAAWSLAYVSIWHKNNSIKTLPGVYLIPWLLRKKTPHARLIHSQSQGCPEGNLLLPVAWM